MRFNLKPWNNFALGVFHLIRPMVSYREAEVHKTVIRGWRFYSCSYPGVHSVGHTGKVSNFALPFCCCLVGLHTYFQVGPKLFTLVAYTAQVFRLIVRCLPSIVPGPCIHSKWLNFCLSQKQLVKWSKKESSRWQNKCQHLGSRSNFYRIGPFIPASIMNCPDTDPDRKNGEVAFPGAL